MRLGDDHTRQLYEALLALAFVMLAVTALWRVWVLLGVLAAPPRRAARCGRCAPAPVARR